MGGSQFLAGLCKERGAGSRSQLAFSGCSRFKWQRTDRKVDQQTFNSSWFQKDAKKGSGQNRHRARKGNVVVGNAEKVWGMAKSAAGNLWLATFPSLQGEGYQQHRILVECNETGWCCYQIFQSCRKNKIKYLSIFSPSLSFTSAEPRRCIILNYALKRVKRVQKRMGLHVYV